MKATVVVGLAWGDEGKGSIVDYLCREATKPVVVRFNGGSQAAHNVITPDGQHHTFAQFGSGTLAGAETHLSRFMLIDPETMINEAAHLRELGISNPFDNLTVDSDCLVITTFHRAANRMREMKRGKNRHGSCGMGIGEAMAHSLAHPEEAIRARDLLNLPTLIEKMIVIQRQLTRELENVGVGFISDDEYMRMIQFAVSRAKRLHEIGNLMRIVPGAHLERIARHSDLIFEGAQGVLLDEWYGFHPYTTWSTCTPKNAMTLLREIGYKEDIERIGVLRTYMTRHGKGPFPTEDDGVGIDEEHNGYGDWQGAFRRGHLDLVLGRYALDVCRQSESAFIDSLAVTHVDRISHLSAKAQVCTGYDERRLFGRVVHSLPVKRSMEDLAAQEKMTKILFKSKPVYSPVIGCDTEHFIKDYLNTISGRLDLPISIVSNGPTAEFKRRTRVGAA